MFLLKTLPLLVSTALLKSSTLYIWNSMVFLIYGENMIFLLISNLSILRSFQHVDNFKQTTHILKSFKAENSNLSDMMRTQGMICFFFILTMTFKNLSIFFSGSSFLCWAFSCASMIRASCSILIKKLLEKGKIDQQRKEECRQFISNNHTSENHKIIRNLIAMILLPKKLHKNDKSQSAFLRAAVSRVSSNWNQNDLQRLHIQWPTFSQ